ncbi:MAG: hypothetical protein U0798_15805 [Gemmataceae bacterium]
MSTKLNDAMNALAFNHSITPDNYLDSLQGRTIDLIEGDGPCLAIVSTKATTVADPISIAFEESNDAAAWSLIATAPSVVISNPLDSVVVRSFQRTKRFVRANLSTDAANDLYLAVVFGQQKKAA